MKYLKLFEDFENDVIGAEELKNYLKDNSSVPENIKKVKGDLILKDMKNVRSLSNLEIIEGDLDISGTSVEELVNVKKIDGELRLVNSPISIKNSDEELKQATGAKNVVL